MRYAFRLESEAPHPLNVTRRPSLWPTYTHSPTSNKQPRPRSSWSTITELSQLLWRAENQSAVRTQARVLHLESEFHCARCKRCLVSFRVKIARDWDYSSLFPLITYFCKKSDIVVSFSRWERAQTFTSLSSHNHYAIIRQQESPTQPPFSA